MPIFKSIGKALKGHDAVSGPIGGQLHWAGRNVEKTHLGGLLSLCAKLYVYFIAIEAFHRMVVRRGTSITSHEADLEKIEAHRMDKLNTLFYGIVDNR